MNWSKLRLSSDGPKKNILVSLAWPYANGEPHVGHIAGVNIPADIFARYHRMRGNNVAMVSGSDMHGTPTMLRALDEGVEPRVVAERYHEIWKDCLERLGINYELYTRTDTDNHAEVTQEIFLRLLDKGYIYEKTEKLPFSESEQIFLPDRLVYGTCPHCESEEARGDQCDNCGRTLDPKDLINIRSKRDGSVPVFKETKHFFLKLTAFPDMLREWLVKIEAQSEWRTNAFKQTQAIINTIQDRAITRDLTWGVPLPPDDSRISGYENKRIYVWFEAVLGYLSATRQWAREIKKQPKLLDEFWGNPDTESYYFMGKDNVPFHAVILPAMLMGSSDSESYEEWVVPKVLNPPTEVVANEFLNLKRKLSKSRGTAVWIRDYLESYDPEPLRYYLTSVMPETSDSEFSWEGFLAANNNELVAIFGNFVNRTMTMAKKYFGGKVPSVPDKFRDVLDKELNRAFREYLQTGDVLEMSDKTLAKIKEMLEPYTVHDTGTLFPTFDMHFNDIYDILLASMVIEQSGKRYLTEQSGKRYLEERVPSKHILESLQTDNILEMYKNALAKSKKPEHITVSDGMPIFESIAMAANAQLGLEKVARCISERRFKDGLKAAMSLAHSGNRYLEDSAPWKQIRDNNRDHAALSIRTVLNVLEVLKIAFYPYLPRASQAIHEMLGASGKVEDQGWRVRELREGQPLGKPRILFRKLDPDIVEKENTKLGIV